MTTSALDRRVGTDALVLTIGGVVVPGTEHGGVAIRGGRADTDRRPEAATMTVEVAVEALPELPTIGTPVTVQLGADAIAYFGLAGDELAAALWRFVGVVTDPAVNAAGVVSITATGRRAQLGRKRVGDTPWPAELDGARAARILALATATADTFTVDGSLAAGWVPWPTTPATLSEAAGELSIPNTAGAQTGAQIATPALLAGVSYTMTVELLLDTSISLFIPATARVDVAGTAVTWSGAGGRSRGQWITATLSWVEPVGGARVIVVRHGSGATINPKTIKVRRLAIYRTAGPDLKLGDLDPGTVEVLARDVDRRFALELLDALAVDSQAELVELRDGRLEWHDALHRDAGDPVVELTADQLLDDLVWTQSLGGLVNDLVVEYGEPGLDDVRPTVRVVDQLSVDDPTAGPAEATLSTQLVTEVDAQALAATTVGRHSRPTWQLDGVTVDLLRTVDPATARKLLGLVFGDLLGVAGQPVSAPLRSGRLWVEGWTETITRKAWRIAFDVSDYGASGPAVTWADIDPAVTWADVDPAVSWLTATSWRPPTATAGRWLDVPARQRWSDIDPGVTWLTYTD